MWSTQVTPSPRRLSRSTPDFLDSFPTALGRFATAEEQASVLVFLAGDCASYLTGQIIPVDDGCSAGVLTGTFEGRRERR